MQACVKDDDASSNTFFFLKPEVHIKIEAICTEVQTDTLQTTKHVKNWMSLAETNRQL